MLVTGVSCVPPPRARRTRTVAVPGAAAPPRRGAAAGAARAARADFRAAQKHTHNAGEGGGGQAPSTPLMGLGLISQSVKTYTLVFLTQLITHTGSVSVKRSRVSTLLMKRVGAGSSQA